MSQNPFGRNQVVEDRSHGKPRVLIVDDDTDFIEFIRAALGLRFEIFSAENGHSAYTLFERHDPDLILTDICMPKMSGFEFIRKVRKISSIPIIVLTGYDISQPATLYDRSIKESVTEVLRKPCNISTVINLSEQHSHSFRKALR